VCRIPSRIDLERTGGIHTVRWGSKAAEVVLLWGFASKGIVSAPGS
jgi:hypothetical protein